MVGPGTNKKNMWSKKEDKRLIIGMNRYFESGTQCKSIEMDPDFGFRGVRSNVDIKDRLLIIFPSLAPYRSFLVPRRCKNPIRYIPREYRHILETEDEQLSVPIRPVAQQQGIKIVIKEHVRHIDKFLAFFAVMPTELCADPVLSVKTWKCLCDKSFKGRDRLSPDRRHELLKDLVKNGHLKTKTVGVRMYVHRTSANEPEIV